MSKTNINLNKIFFDLLFLTNCFGMDLFSKIKGPAKALSFKTGGIKEASILKATICRDEFFIFIVYLFYIKTEKLEKSEYFYKNNILPELSKKYCENAEIDENSKNIFCSKIFNNLFLERFGKYLDLYYNKNEYISRYFLEIAAYSMEFLRYYENDDFYVLYGKMDKSVMEDIEWLDDKVDKLVYEHFFN